MLESMKPDIWLPAHTQVPGFAEKLARADKKDGVQGWVDPQGYRRWLSDEKQSSKRLSPRKNRAPLDARQRIPAPDPIFRVAQLASFWLYPRAFRSG